MLKGIDISNHQAGYVIPSDLDFCICKATEGLSFVDRFCDGFVTQCTDKGILWGFYHYANTSQPEKEASYFVDNCRNYFGSGIPVLDIEEDKLGDWGAYANAFCEVVHNLTGVWPMVYVSAGHLDRLSNFKHTHECGLWLAGYPSNSTEWPNSTPPYRIAPWDIVAIWQFTSAKRLAGYTVDADVAYMDARAWMLYAGANPNSIDVGGKTDMTPGDVWSYNNPDITKLDVYAIVCETHKMTGQLMKEIVQLEKEIIELKGKK